MRHNAAIILNLWVPGAGLILARREWLGTTLALLYGILAQIGLWGCLIEPARVPTWLAVTSLSGAAGVWLAAQILLRQRLPILRNPEIAGELHDLRAQAAAHAARGRYEEAWGALQVALTINDEDIETQIQAAELMTALGRFGDARRTWRHVAQLDRKKTHDRRIDEALRGLPDR